MSFWSFKTPDIPLQDTLDRLATLSFQSELEQWDFLDKNLVRTNQWSINLHQLYRFQTNLHGLQSSEFRRVIGDLIAEKATRQGLNVLIKTNDEIVLEFK